MQFFKSLKAKKPKDLLKEFRGKKLLIKIDQHPDGEWVVVESIVGSAVHPTRFEVNGQFHIVILDAYKQLNADHSITQEQIDEFDKIVVESIAPINPAPDLIAASAKPKYEAPDGQTDGV